MSDNNVDYDQDREVFPVEPRYHPIHKIPRKIYNFLASAKLAMALLVVVLVFCLIGVTVYRGEEAWRLIFNTLWFNGLLVLLVINVACCFFGRIWGRRITVVSFGMILFHLSFVMVFLSIAYNSLFYFRGKIRLTEGESLSSSDPNSYDSFERGRFFSFTHIKGETKLIKMHTGYKVGSEDKRWAYEVAVGEQDNRKQDIIYITHKLTHNGFDYFNDREGLSLSVDLLDKQGNPIYGAFLPLQSIEQPDGSYVYATGVKDGNKVTATPMFFPPLPEKPRFAMQIAYFPSKIDALKGDVECQLYPLDLQDRPLLDTPLVNAKKSLGAKFASGDYAVAGGEVRYWVSMLVRYEPGKPVLLASLWVGLAGLIITTVGRMFKKPGRA